MYTNYRSNIERLELFVELSESLRPGDSSVLSSRSGFLGRVKARTFDEAKTDVIASNPGIESNQSLFLQKVSSLQQELENLYWQKHLDHYIKLRTEMPIVHLITITEIYFDNVLVEVFNKNIMLIFQGVEMESMSYSDIVKFSSKEDIHSHLIRKRVDQIMKYSLKRMIKTIEKLCSSSDNCSDDKIKALTQLWDTRNLIIHQNAISDAHFERSYGIPNGSPVVIPDGFFDTNRDLLEKIISRIDKTVIKFLGT